MNLSVKFLLLTSKLTLAALWIFTGLTSVFFYPELGFNIITEAGFEPNTAELLIYCGSTADIAVGVWVLSSWKVRFCSFVQVGFIITYTILLTLFDASYWLHPFGPITKNFPILVLILITLKLQDTKR
ncbi:DoxX-like family protein [Kangiella shandongensis]|uniref:DoxX-like family protein n=1 Tax=Kangiella shandongensis TaxID=2763258 RepID=UPI001CC028EA